MKLDRLFNLVLCVGLIGCFGGSCADDTSDNSANQPLSTAKGQIWLDNVEAYGALSQTVKLAALVGVQEDIKFVELYASCSETPVAVSNEQPYMFVWDTTQCLDGLNELRARATFVSGKTLTSAAVPVIVMNHGQEANLDASTGSIKVVGTDEHAWHKRHYWMTPAGVAKILAIVFWEEQESEEPWRIELRTGQGICPHRGKQYGDPALSEVSPTVLNVTANELNPPLDTFPETPANPDPATEIYFLHVAPINVALHEGETLSYQVKVFLFE